MRPASIGPRQAIDAHSPAHLASRWASRVAELGFKTLTQQNFLERDPTLQAFFAGLTQTDLMDDVFAAQLSAGVPDDVKALFEGARGAMCYGFYFYPLFMLGADQLCRVAETAVRLN